MSRDLVGVAEGCLWESYVFVGVASMMPELRGTALGRAKPLTVILSWPGLLGTALLMLVSVVDPSQPPTMALAISTQLRKRTGLGVPRMRLTTCSNLEFFD